MSVEHTADDALIASLADGTPIDWTAVDRAATTDAERQRFRDLRLVARLVDLQRTLSDEEETHEADGVPDGTAGAVPWMHLERLELIAGGAYGDVYRAWDPTLEREVALKVLRADATGPGDAARLLREARLLAQVRHSNVVTVHGAAAAEGRVALWMDLIDGSTLEQCLIADGPFDPADVASIGIDVCRALAAVHDRKIVHGDIKSQNVMRDRDGRIVLMDFGSSRPALSPPELVAGTPLYSAPEILAGGVPSRSSDLYAVGVLLFHALTGTFPYVGGSIEELRLTHAERRRLKVRDARPNTPTPLIEVIERALDSDPECRYESASDLEAALVAASARPRPMLRPVMLAFLVAAVLLSTAGVAVVAPFIRAGGQAPRPRSLTVLPFTSLDGSSTPTTGLGEEIARELQLFDVTVRNGSDALVMTAGVGGPRVDAELRGKTGQDGGREMLDVEIRWMGGDAFWAQRYPLSREQLPRLASTIATEAALALGVPRRAGASVKSHIPNGPAFDAYARGREQWRLRTQTSLQNSLALYKRASELDPYFAEPWAGMADTYMDLGVAAFGPLSPLEARRSAREAAEHALEIDPDLAEAQTTLAFAAYFHDWNWREAQSRFQRAIKLNPQYATAHHWYADYLTAMGRPAEALEEIHEAGALDPESRIIARDVAWHLFFAQKYEEATAQLEWTLKTDPHYGPSLTLLARVLAERGLFDEAIATLARAEEQMNDRRAVYLSFLAYIQAASGNGTAARETLGRVESARATSYVPPYYLALVYAALGEKARAIAALDASYREQDSTLVNLRADPRFASLRQEPGFVRIVEAMHFPPQ